MNMNTPKIENQIAALLKVLGSSFRVRLLYSIGYGEACVCHLESLLKKRQSYISQHLMVLRDAGLLETRREGKYIFYRVADPDIFKLIELTAALQDIPGGQLPPITQPGTQDNCACPNCDQELTQVTTSE
jgi:ArsR family transcriptional regulator